MKMKHATMSVAMLLSSLTISNSVHAACQDEAATPGRTQQIGTSANGLCPIKVDQTSTTDIITYLTGGSADRPDTAHILPLNGQLAKHTFLVELTSNDTLEWKVNVEGPGEYFDVTVRMQSQSETDTYLLSVVGGTSSAEQLTFSTRQGWVRDHVGQIYLPQGTHTIRMQRTSGEGHYELKALEIMQSNKRAAYLERVAAHRNAADTVEFTKDKMGLMFQYGAWGYPEFGEKKSIDNQAGDFDVQKFADFVASTGAEYIIWSATWYTYQFDQPVKAVDTILQNYHAEQGTTPILQRTTSRNLNLEIATALADRNIDFYLYYHTGQDIALGYESTDWWRAQKFPASTFHPGGIGDKSVFINNWISVVEEIGEQFGDKLKGWFFDDAMVYYPAPYERMAAAARAGNPGRLMSFNPWHLSNATDFDDISFGETCYYQDTEVGGNGIHVKGPLKGLLGHCTPTLNQNWGVHWENQEINLWSWWANVDNAYSYVKDHNSRGYPLTLAIMMWEDGKIGPETKDMLLQLGERLEVFKCEEECVNNTSSKIRYSEGHWQLSSNRTENDYQSDVHYAGSLDAYFEFDFNGTGVALFMPKHNTYADFEVFIDGVSQGIFTSKAEGNEYLPQIEVFKHEKLSIGNHTIRVENRGGGYLQIDKIETIGAQESVEVPNNDSIGINYVGAWTEASNRTEGDYNNDVHYTQTNGDYFEYTFYGYGIDVVMPLNQSYGDFEVFIDNVSQGVYTANNGSSAYTAQQYTFSNRNLPLGQHTIRVVKLNGLFMQLDKLHVFAGFNDNAPNIRYKGNWHVSANRNPGDINDDVHATTTQGDSFVFDFIGEGFSLVMPTYSAYSDFEVFIDGVSYGVHSSNQSGSTYIPQVKTFEVSGLTSKFHSVEVVNLGTQQYFQLDGVILK
ncbi:hypothetical protein NF212_09505 [Parasalinivibrio latis]|uniref:hypothetical protein n=1 Tax=Parasalinivibrio latis TaxID=2952610 RepID=UPI0030E53DD2